ncbi:MAG: M48 family metalloprotease [Armatimonadetes bacterium]|nr:M48 family metalloprotease [Armatimonadota bacterium]
MPTLPMFAKKRIGSAQRCLCTLTSGLMFLSALPLYAEPPATPIAAQVPVKPATTPIPIPKPDDPEVKLGRDNAVEHDKQTKFINDPIQLERVRRIGNDLAQAVNAEVIPAIWGSPQLKQFQYIFKIVDDKDVNAYCMPGGFVYVNRGLLEMVHSDDELAGVLAHEIAHAAHHHILRLLKEQAKIQNLVLPIQLLALVATFAGRGGNTAYDAANIWQATQLYAIAKTNSYGVEAEKDADHTGVFLMMKTKYNPVGLYSFMIRLAALERRKVAFKLGIFQTHPAGEERVSAAKQLLTELKVPLLLSEVDPSLQSTVTMLPATPKGVLFAEVRSMGIPLCKVVAQGDMPAQERAKRLAKRFDQLFDTGLSTLDIQMSRDRSRVMARGQTLLSQVDFDSLELPVEDILRQLKEAIIEVRQKRAIEMLL